MLTVKLMAPGLFVNARQAMKETHLFDATSILVNQILVEQMLTALRGARELFASAEVDILEIPSQDAD